MRRVTWWTALMVVMVGLTAVTPVWASGSYVFHDLGDLGGGSSQALGINEYSWVVGKTKDSHNTLQSFLWMKNQGMICLTNDSVARKVNNAGLMVGELYSGGHNQAIFLTSPGSYQSLGTLGGQDSLAYAVNDQGVVVGYSDVAAQVFPYTRQHAFIWTAAGGMVDLGTLGGWHSCAYGINNHSQVVGRAEVASGYYHAFVWDGTGGLQDLNLPGINSVARDINNLGYVVGNFFYDPDNPQYYANAFIWTPGGGFLDLGNLGGYYAQANAINDQGVVVGHYVTTQWQHAFIWTQEKGMQDLNLLVDKCPVTIVDVFDINNAGEIVGVTAAGRACLLSPVATPVPGSLFLVGGGLLTLFASRRIKKTNIPLALRRE